MADPSGFQLLPEAAGLRRWSIRIGDMRITNGMVTWCSGLRLAAAVVALLPACAMQQAAEPPSVVYDNVHSGGSVVAFNMAGDVLASGGWEGGVRLWSASGQQRLARWKAHDDSVNGLGFTVDDRYIITAGYDGVVARWDRGGNPIRQHQTPSPVTHMVLAATTGEMVTGHADGVVRVWRLSDFHLLQARGLHRGPVRAVAVDPERRRYASSGADGVVQVFRESGPARQLAAPPFDSWTLAFSPDGQSLYGGGWFRLFRWHLADGSIDVLPTRHHGIIRSIQFLNGGSELATISRQTDSSVYFLDPRSGEVTREFQQHALCGASVAVSGDGRYLGTTSDDASVRIWDLAPAGGTPHP
jgi:WD40 repeat protein